MASLPLAKLVLLAIRQLSKPLSSRIKEFAKNSDKLKRYILIPPARIFHSMEQTFRLRMMGLPSGQTVKPLTENAAVDLGAELLGESVIFSIAALCLLIEYKRQKAISRRLEMALQDRLLNMENGIVESKNNIDNLNKLIHDYDEKIAKLVQDQKSNNFVTNSKK